VAPDLLQQDSTVSVLSFPLTLVWVRAVAKAVMMPSMMSV